VTAAARLLRQGGLNLDNIRYNSTEGRWQWKRLSETENSDLATAGEAEAALSRSVFASFQVRGQLCEDAAAGDCAGDRCKFDD
jgi:hypothetical protein